MFLWKYQNYIPVTLYKYILLRKYEVVFQAVVLSSIVFPDDWRIFITDVCSIYALAFIYLFVFQFRTVRRILLSRRKGDDGATMCN